MAESTTVQISWSSLPYPVLCRMFEFLSYESLHSAKLVCRHWLGVCGARELQRKIDFGKYEEGKLDLYIQMMKNSFNTEHVVVYYTPISFFEIIHQYLPRISIFEFNINATSHSRREYGNSVSSFSFLLRFKHLKKIDISRMPMLHPEVIENLSKECKRVEAIKLSPDQMIYFSRQLKKSYPKLIIQTRDDFLYFHYYNLCSSEAGNNTHACAPAIFEFCSNGRVTYIYKKKSYSKIRSLYRRECTDWGSYRIPGYEYREDIAIGERLKRMQRDGFPEMTRRSLRELKAMHYV